MKRRPVYVKWLDHHSFHLNQWRELEEFDEITLFEVETIGWLVRETKSHLVVAGHCCFSEEKCNGEMMILKKVVVERRPLEL